MMPLPDFLRAFPPQLAPVEARATEAEIDEANRLRAHFAFPGAAPEFMKDIVRGFRLLEGAETYIEVGSRDKGNLGWLTDRLSAEALMIDVDIDQVVSAQDKLKAMLKPAQRAVFIEGDSIARSTMDQVRGALDGRLADGIFLDSSHMYDHFLTELAKYWPLLKPGGVLFVHDIFWEGTEEAKGKAQACMQLNAVLPIWCVCKQDPIHRYMLQPDKAQPRWGGLGLMLKPQAEPAPELGPEALAE